MPGSERHIFFGRIGPGDDDFGGCFPGYGIEQFVLGFGEKHLCGFVSGVIITAEGKKVAYFLIKPFFGSPDIPDALKQFIKVLAVLFIKFKQALLSKLAHPRAILF